MRVAEQQCKVKNHNCQIMYPEQTPYSHHTCFRQKISKWLSKKVSQAACMSTRILYFLIKCTSSQWVTLL